jgi:hypothetical protein
MTRNILTVPARHWRIQALAERGAAPSLMEHKQGRRSGLKIQSRTRYFWFHLSKDEAVGADELTTGGAVQMSCYILLCVAASRVAYGLTLTF